MGGIMRFTKMQGIGNDYVYVNCFKEQVPTPSVVAKHISNRHFGIGSDGLILICPSEVADCKMVMYNSDGTQSEMCGNGVRCVGKYIHDKGLTDKTEVLVETLDGIKKLHTRTLFPLTVACGFAAKRYGPERSKTTKMVDTHRVIN